MPGLARLGRSGYCASRAAAARTAGLALDRARAGPRHPQADRDPGGAGGHQAPYRLEVSSIAAIIDLVCAGYGHAVLHASAVAASGRADLLRARPLVEPRLNSMLCLAVSAHKRPSPLMRQAIRLLSELVRSLPQGAAAQSQPG